MSQQKSFKISESYQMPYEIFKIDFETFQSIFVALSPWGRGCHMEIMTREIFKVINCENLKMMREIYIYIHTKCLRLPAHGRKQ